MLIWLLLRRSHATRCSADPDGEIRNISIEDCIETAMKIFDGQTRAIKGFRNFTEGRSPFHDDLEKLQDPLDFLHRVKVLKETAWLLLVWVLVWFPWLLT